MAILVVESRQQLSYLAQLLLLLFVLTVLPCLEEIDFERLPLALERLHLVEHLDALLRVFDVVEEHISVLVTDVLAAVFPVDVLHFFQPERVDGASLTELGLRLRR